MRAVVLSSWSPNRELLSVVFVVWRGPLAWERVLKRSMRRKWGRGKADRSLTLLFEGPATTQNLVVKFDGEICGGVLVDNASDDFPQKKKLEYFLPNFAGSSPPISPITSPTSLWKSLVLIFGDLWLAFSCVFLGVIFGNRFVTFGFFAYPILPHP